MKMLAQITAHEACIHYNVCIISNYKEGFQLGTKLQLSVFQSSLYSRQSLCKMLGKIHLPYTIRLLLNNRILKWLHQTHLPGPGLRDSLECQFIDEDIG